MVQVYLYQRRKKKLWAEEFIDWLERAGGFVLELARIMLNFGLLLQHIARLFRQLFGYSEDWREEYR